MTAMKKVVIGNYRLYCGDCFAILPNLLIKADALISDPAFGITTCDWAVALPFGHFWKVVKRKTTPAANVVLFGCGRFSRDLINSNRKWYRYDLVWLKNNKVGFLNANKMLLRNHESIMEFLVKSYSDEGDTIIDPFMEAARRELLHYRIIAGSSALKKSDSILMLRVRESNKQMPNGRKERHECHRIIRGHWWRHTCKPTTWTSNRRCRRTRLLLSTSTHTETK